MENLKEKIIDAITKRSEFFKSVHHTYESNECMHAIDIIERLIPPDWFEDFIPESLEDYEVMDFQKTYKNKKNTK